MPDQTQIPFRKRCDNQGIVCTSARFQHKKPGETVDVFSPATSPTPLQHDTGNVSSDCEKCDSVGTGSSGADGYKWQSAVFDNAEMWQGLPENLLTIQNYNLGAKIDLGECHKSGFKNVFAGRNLHGRLGFFSTDSCDDTTRRANAPDNTRYRTIKRSVKATITGDDTVTQDPATDACGGADFTGKTSMTGIDWQFEQTGIFTANDLSGVITRSGFVNGQALGGTFASDTEILIGVGFRSRSFTFTDQEIDGSGALVFSHPPDFTDVGCDGVTPVTYSPFIQYPAGQSTLSGQILSTALFALLTTDAACSTITAPAALSGVTSAADIQTYLETVMAGLGLYSTAPTLGSSTADFTNTKISGSVSGTLAGTFPLSTDPTPTETLGLGITLEFTIELSDPITADDLMADVIGNLAVVIPLDDDAAYPWRRDPWFGIMPKVERRELPDRNPDVQEFGLVDDLRLPVNNGSGDVPFSAGWIADPKYTQMNWFDAGAHFWVFAPGTDATNAAATDLKASYDGAIIGTMNPAGYYGAFDFYFNDIRFCYCDPAFCAPKVCAFTFQSYEFAFGGSLADCDISLSSHTVVNGRELWESSNPPTIPFSSFLPANATHWTNNAEAHSFPRGACMANRGAGGHAVSIVKAAFARLPVPSYNFARPFGSDRILIDEPTAKNVVAEVPTVSITLESAFASVSGLTVLVAFTGGSDGIYTGCTQAGSVLTLGTKISDLPTDYYHDFADVFTANGGLAGIVRFPDCPAIYWNPNSGDPGARISIADDGAGHTIVPFTEPQTSLRVGDALDFANAALADVQSNKAVLTRTSDTEFVVDVAFATMTGALWATSHGAPAYYWNDASQKFELRYGGWTTDFRNLTAGLPTVAFDGCNPDCLPFSPCDPQVICFSPNGEVFPSGHTYWFGSDGLPSFSPDAFFGALAQASVEFELPDLLWQPPKVPLGTVDGNSYNAREDDGTCADDGLVSPITLIYRPQPRMEARCGVVTGAGGNGAGPSRTEDSPVLPTDSLGNTLTWPAMVQPVAPGVVGESYNIELTPEYRYANELNTLQANPSCRFANFYYSKTIGGGR